MDLIYRKGIGGMLNAISDTAKYGGLMVGPKIIDNHVKENMRLAVADIQDGNFAKSWIEEHKNGEKKLKKLINEFENHDLERIGKLIRKMTSIEHP
jgi:ketol-acid reductoisomerase